MTPKSRLAAIGLLLTFASAEAAPLECPAKSAQMEDVIALLNEAKGCDAAMQAFEACQFGASGDVQFGEVVEKKCEADFLDTVKPSRKRSYGRELGVCDRKYRNRSGTMYLSATAFCRAQIAQRFAREARRAAGAR